LYTAKRSILALVSAVGVKDGHGIHGHEEGDVYELEQLVPDRDARAEVLDVAAQVMEHRQFKAVRDALWRTLTFKDHLSRGQIQKIAASVTTIPGADLPPGEPCVEATTSARRRVLVHSTQRPWTRHRGTPDAPGGPSIIQRWPVDDLISPPLTVERPR
jgi:hypothetical protein